MECHGWVYIIKFERELLSVRGEKVEYCGEDAEAAGIVDLVSYVDFFLPIVPIVV